MDMPLEPVGHAWLHDRLDLEVPPPAHSSFVGATCWRSEVEGSWTRACYTVAYDAVGDLIAYGEFALQHQPTDLTVLVAALRRAPAKDLEARGTRAPTGASPVARGSSTRRSSALVQGQANGIAPSQVMIPLSYTAVLGGTVAPTCMSTNLVVDGVAGRGTRGD